MLPAPLAVALPLLLASQRPCPPPAVDPPVFFGVVDTDSRLEPLGVCTKDGCGRVKRWPKERVREAAAFRAASAARVPPAWWGDAGAPPAGWFLRTLRGTPSERRAALSPTEEPAARSGGPDSAVSGTREATATPLRLGGVVKVNHGQTEGWRVLTSAPRLPPGEEWEPYRFAASSDLPWTPAVRIGADSAAAGELREFLRPELLRLEKESLRRGRQGRHPGPHGPEIAAFGTEKNRNLPIELTVRSSGPLPDGTAFVHVEMFRSRPRGEDVPGRYPGSPTSTIEAWVRRGADGTLRLLSSRHVFDEEFEFEGPDPLGFLEIGGHIVALVRYWGEISQLFTLQVLCEDGVTRIDLWGEARC